ncbi:MAG: M16 family metallopeptidase [Gemmatimonadaceae bacterium]
MPSLTRHARRRAWPSFAALLAALGAGSFAGAQASPIVAPLQFTRVVLPNGLVAVFNEDHSSPIVAVGIAYHVGGKDEKTGATGLAHLCEHMMFMGSKNVKPGEFMSTIRAGGGTSSHWAETSEDRTFYYETVPSTQLEMALWLESDRMMTPFGSADSSQLDVARAAIKNERQQRENIPFSAAEPLTIGLLYGSEHPYRGGLGPMEDLNRATFSDMRAFCKPYYVPNNAVVALSGDFETRKARAMVEKYFGGIKRGGVPAHPVMKSALTAERRVVLEDPRGRGPSLRLAWSGVGFADPDKGALRALASVLTGGRNSGLIKALIYDHKLATFVLAAHFDNEKGGVFQIAVVPAGTTPLGAIEDVVDSVVHAARETRPTDAQLMRFKRADADTAVLTLQSRQARVDTLTQGQGWAGDPIAYAKQQSATSRLTPEDVQRVAVKYLTPNRVVLSLVPAGKLQLVSKPDRPYDNAMQIMPAEVKR